MEDRNASIPEGQRIRFRIGINLGDIIIDEGDLFGDGVNVAARLQALAEPGEICVSASVREQIGEKLPISLPISANMASRTSRARYASIESTGGPRFTPRSLAISRWHHHPFPSG